ncbi:uncharacterized protein BDR25DRAFT_345081 [Lindgomyces ingoldianus]|uniref:Uncharacterized protein n=1 Tax=Lindgomyces ingoldianus TaxID=673940 RepID=A0ACB6QK59_9PLEO|nr:uncharacterized protein BDR25DRAFT_345081 [Lindgomyces ingoldianus]KAF2467349.1 hypothetical protein BDR25DRAFT_345081 [Lindgomyces ingoldianus]
MESSEVPNRHDNNSNSMFVLENLWPSSKSLPATSDVAFSIPNATNAAANQHQGDYDPPGFLKPFEAGHSSTVGADPGHDGHFNSVGLASFESYNTFLNELPTTINSQPWENSSSFSQPGGHGQDFLDNPLTGFSNETVVLENLSYGFPSSHMPDMGGYTMGSNSAGLVPAHQSRASALFAQPSQLPLAPLPATSAADSKEDRIPCTAPGCRKSFRRPGDFRRHLKIHGDPDFRCIIKKCPKTFTRLDKLRDHAKVHGIKL